MKKILPAIFCLLVSGATAQNADTDIMNYFTATLNDTDASFTADEIIPIANIADARSNVWSLWKNSVEQFPEEKLITLGALSAKKTGSWTLPASLEPNAIMPYYWGVNTSVEPATKYPMFLYMHGSGDKDSEWSFGYSHAMSQCHRPGAYFIPQIPNTGEYYRWAIQSKQWAWEKLLRLAFLNDNIDANRIYFFGISEGGYGSQRLASFYADYLAGAGPMAGGEPLKNAPMENVANIAFSLRTGANDTSFGRNIMTAKAKEVADSLQALHPEYYNHYIETIPGYGHGIDYAPTTPWLAQFERNPHPKYFYWENYEMYGRRRRGFYCLRENITPTLLSTQRACYEVSIENNTVSLNVRNVRYTCTYSSGGIEMFFSKKFTQSVKGNVTLFLHDELIDFEKPVTVILNGTEIFCDKVLPTLKALVESCALFYDPERLFPASIDIDIAEGCVRTTSVEEHIIPENNTDSALYNLQGRRVEGTPDKGIYIRNGRKIFVE